MGTRPQRHYGCHLKRAERKEPLVWQAVLTKLTSFFVIIVAGEFCCCLFLFFLITCFLFCFCLFFSPGFDLFVFIKRFFIFFGCRLPLNIRPNVLISRHKNFHLHLSVSLKKSVCENEQYFTGSFSVWCVAHILFCSLEVSRAAERQVYDFCELSLSLKAH